jgi:hypothetical protein
MLLALLYFIIGMEDNFVLGLGWAHPSKDGFPAEPRATGHGVKLLIVVVVCAIDGGGDGRT